MSILEGLKDPSSLFANAAAVDAADFPDRFDPNEPTKPHTVEGTLAFIHAVAQQALGKFVQDDYIIAFAKQSPVLRALDETLQPIAPHGMQVSGTSYPEVISTLARQLSHGNFDYRGRQAFLQEHFVPSKTLHANLNGFGYQGYKPEEPGAVWAIRQAFTALGGRPAEFNPPTITKMVAELRNVYPEHAEAFTMMREDYRFVTPRAPAHDVK